MKTAIIRIEQASVYTPATGTITKGTKNLTSTRAVSIPQSVMTLLRQYKILQNETRLKLGDKWQESNRVFTQWNGIPAHPHSFNTWLRKFCVREDFPLISPHIFRHMAATYLILKGTDIRTVSGKLGHARASITFDTYSHLLPSAEQETAKTMENILESMKVEKKAGEK